MSRALVDAGWTVAAPVRRGEDVRLAADGTDLLLIATPDAAVAEVAAAVAPVPTTVVAHLAGSLGLDVLASHERRASIHPLVSIPTGETDVRGAWFAVAGDELSRQVVAALDGRAVVVDDEHRAAYHAAACIASNHLVALLGQVDRVGRSAGVPLDAFLALARQTIDNVAAVGPQRALTGPVRRGDHVTVDRHRAALAADERGAYDAMVEQAERLVASA
ncbi:MAG TPA: DUF2520 domain-containing protein [Acidimicrobiales bacterium]|nr:DUF2520 domain-containing protein [Acidimicrobiales bacterium]